MNRQSKLIVTLGLALSTTLGSVACGPTPTPTPAPAPAPDNAVGPWNDPGCMSTGKNYYNACCKAQSSGTCFLKPGNAAFCNVMQYLYSGYSPIDAQGDTNKRSQCCSGSASLPGTSSFPLRNVNFKPDSDGTEVKAADGGCPDTLPKANDNGKGAPMCVNYLSVEEMKEAESASTVQSVIKSALSTIGGKVETVNTNKDCKNQQ